MNTNRKQKSTFTDKKDQKVIRYFSQLSKQKYLSKSKKLFSNKDKKIKEDINNTQNQNKFSNRATFSNDVNSKYIKKINPKININRPKNNNQIKDISQNKLTKKLDNNNIISISTISKNNLISEDKINCNNIINNIENNSNINIGSNNKITIIKNIFNRSNKPQIKNKNKKIQDMKIKIIKTNNKNDILSGNTKKYKNKIIYKGIKNSLRNKIVNKQNLSTYNSIENLNNENNNFVSLKNQNKNNILHFNTISDNLKHSSRIKNIQNKLSISIENQKKLFYMNLSHTNFINTYPSLNNLKSEPKQKIKNIKTIKTLSINSDNNYKKIYRNIKRKKIQKKINLIRCLNKLGNPGLNIKNKISSTIENNNNIVPKKSSEKTEKYSNNNDINNKKTIDNIKIKKIYNNSKNFYHKIKAANLKSARAKSINVNLINNTKNKQLLSNKTNNNIDFSSETKNNQKKISPFYRDTVNNKENDYENDGQYINMIKSCNSLNFKDEQNNINFHSKLKEKVNNINDFYKTKELSRENKNKLNDYTTLKKYNTNMKIYDINIRNNEANKNIEIEEEQIIDNIYHNSLTMYSIYLLSKYYDYNKIGLSQIFLYDNKNNIIPILFSNSNNNYNTSFLFANKTKYIKINNNTKNTNIKIQNNYFICEFKQNLYINFFVKNIQSNNIHHIKIINYYNNAKKISPCKDIKIYKGNILLYEGILNIYKQNIIILDTKDNKEKNDIKYIDSKNIFSTLSSSSRKNFSFININNSNKKLKLKKPELSYNSPNNKILKNENNNNLRNCLFGAKSQNKLINNIKINHIFNQEQKYVKFEDICLVFISNYGHKEYVGLTGIEFIDNKGKIINIEKAKTIGALPKDLYTIYNDEKEKRIFENVFNGDNNTTDINNMWVTKLINNNNNSLPNHSYIELSFYDKICLSKIKIYNYNDKNNLDICAKEIKLFFDNKYYGTITLRQGIGEEIFGFIDNKIKTKSIYPNNENEDFSQDITFPLNNYQIDKEFIYKQLTINKYSYSNNHNYETPYLPSCFIVKFQFNNNYSPPKNNLIFDTYEDIFNKYNIIGLNQIEIYNEKGINILNNNNYKIVSNCEILNEDIKGINSNQILLNGIQNENGNNCLFYIFNNPIFISYIKLFPLELKDNIFSENSVKNFKIFCDNYVVFEGVMNNNKPSIVYFTSDKNILNNLDVNLFIQCRNNNRIIKEEKKDKYISLILV